MRLSAFSFSVLLLPSVALAQDPGVSLNMGRGLDNGGSINWTFKENWTLRPTLGAGYSRQTGFQASLGSTILRSIGSGHRVYGYLGAGLYYGSANLGRGSSYGAPGQGAPGIGGAQGSPLQGSPYDPLLNGNAGNVAYMTTPIGLRARIHGNVEAFAEAAYQKALSGQFGLNQTGQFTGNGGERFGATFGISLRLN